MACRFFASGPCPWCNVLAPGFSYALPFTSGRTPFCAQLFPILAVLVSGRPLRQRLSGLAAIVFGAMGAWAIVIAFIARFGDVSGYFWTVFVHAQKYASAGNMRDLAALAWFFWNRPLAFLMMMYATLAADRRHFWLVALLVTVGLLGWMLPMRSYGHYWGSSLPYIALLIGLGTERLADIRPLSWASPIALAATLIPSALLNEYQISTTSYLPYEGLAAAAERIAPKDSTLMVHGEMGAEAIQFGSRLPAANTYCWTFQMQSPWKDLFPIPWREIRDKYLASPPGAIVIHENELRIAAATQAPAEMPEYMELLRALLKSHRYNFVAKEGDYVIGIRGDQLNAEP